MHTPGHIKNLGRVEKCEICNFFAIGRSGAVTAYVADNGDAKLYVAAHNSFDKHFGANAIDAAEADLLGEALQIIRDITSNSERRQEEAKMKACDLLAKTKGANHD